MINILFESENNRSAAYDDKKEIGESTFSKSEGLWIIDHTFVEENYQGQGIARKLVAELVVKARESSTKILPLCPYAKREFDKTPEYSDVLKK
nr:GNAT family N-acetyltransferase [Tissierella sp.]